MERQKFISYLNSFPVHSTFYLKWDRKNGALEREVELISKPSAYSSDKLPKLKFLEGEEFVDYRLIGGIESIISIEEIADGMC